MKLTPAIRVDNADDFWASASVYWRWDTEEGDDLYVRWMIRPPCGHHFMLSGGTDDKPHHCVEENEDGTITVRPNPPDDPKNSNSILCPQCNWHGYIEGGNWREI